LLVDVLFFPDADREELTCTGLVKLEFGRDTNRNLCKMGFGRNIQDTVLAEFEGSAMALLPLQSLPPRQALPFSLCKKD
jgi:hypothetical protein